MAFNADGWQNLSGFGKTAPNLISYQSSVDSLLTVSASGYFNEFIDQLEVGYTIFVEASDNNQLLRVTSVTTNVTVENYLSNDLDGTVVANIGQIGNLAGIPVLYQALLPGGASSGVGAAPTHKFRVIDVWVRPNALGTAGDTIQVFNGTSSPGNELTEAIDINVPANRVVHADDIIFGKDEFAALSTLTIEIVDGGGSDVPATQVYILGMRIA